MSPRAVRVAVIVVCVAGIAGMIVSSIADKTGAALTFGVIIAVAVLVLIAVTASGPQPVSEDDAARLEASIQQLVAAGADEAAVRDLVRQARRL
ncbi:MAG: hypothetical protein QOJ09_2872 [Actinomycetota bacterium]|jgi:uncharacterized membrane protein YjjP (DUF1212 family)|nr:hypothetical protein [Actinomycetota bacterium]